MFHAHVSTAQQLIANYKHQKPFALYLKSFFNANRKFGARDRKTITQYCYNLFRLGKALPSLDFTDRLHIANFIIDHIIDEKATLLTGKYLSGNIENRIDTIKQIFPEFNAESVFPFTSDLSDGIDKNEFVKSIFKQPKVFIRVRNNFETDVKNELVQNNISFENPGNNTLAFAQQLKLTQLKSYDKGWFEIQDVSSQQTGRYLNAHDGEYWWDCCSGSGGKSLMFADRNPLSQLLVSDNRETIIHNAMERLQKAGVLNAQFAVIDLLQDDIKHALTTTVGMQNGFDGIIVDAPCCGSGTWSRTPEEISFFNTQLLNDFSQRQKQIVSKVVPFLKTGGQLLYITCSVFRQENEEVVAFIRDDLKLSPVESRLIAGYQHLADTLFVAVFKK